MTIETYTVPSAGISLSLLIWRRYQKPSPGIIEGILDANPGLYAVAEDLTPGMVIRLPAVPEDDLTVQPVTLWG